MTVKLNITINQGVDLEKLIYQVRSTTGTPVANASANAYGSLKVNYTANASYVIPEVLYTSNGSVIIKGAAQWTTSLKPGRYVYDIVIRKDESTERIIEGYCSVEPMVTFVQPIAS